jgi:hypothetical protein
MKTVYQTKDGKVFNTSTGAAAHEYTLFRAWLKTDEAEPYRQLCKSLDNKLPDESYGTDRELAMGLLRVFWSKLP